MILIDAVYINTGGGKVLLDYIISELEKTDNKILYLLDNRVKNKIQPIKSQNKIIFLNGGLFDRAKFYFFNKNKFNTIFCLGNMPPLKKMKARVFTYFHQTIFLEIPDDINWLLKMKYSLKVLLLSLSIKFSDFWIVQSDNIKISFSKKFNVSKDKIKVLPFYSSLPHINNVKKEKGIYAYIGDAFMTKNHKILIEAFSDFFLLHKKGKLILTISEQEKEILNLIEEKKKINIPIENVGMVNREKVAEILQTSEYLVYPSLAESFGLSIVEAIDKDCKIIGADLPYMYTACDPSITFNPHDKKSLVDALSLSLQKDIKKSVSKIPNNIFEIINLLN